MPYKKPKPEVLLLDLGFLNSELDTEPCGYLSVLIEILVQNFNNAILSVCG